MPEKFSVLLPVWRGDRADWLELAFRTTVDEQTRRPDEVVIVRDGPVDPAVAAVLTRLVDSGPVPVTVVELPKQRTLGLVLDAGLAVCTHDIVARMDADDASAPDRFARQLPLIEAGADIVGSGLREFDHVPDDLSGRVRTPPLGAAISAAARWESPFNHPSVVFRRDVVRAVGGYSDFPLMEDYLLWAKLIQAQVRVENVPEPLVYYRVGAGSYARRGGMAQFRTELAVQREFRRIGFTTRSQWLRNVALRGAYRLVPEAVRRTAYRTVHALRSTASRRI